MSRILILGVALFSSISSASLVPIDDHSEWTPSVNPTSCKLFLRAPIKGAFSLPPDLKITTVSELKVSVKESDGELLEQLKNVLNRMFQHNGYLWRTDKTQAVEQRQTFATLEFNVKGQMTVMDLMLAREAVAKMRNDGTVQSRMKIVAVTEDTAKFGNDLAIGSNLVTSSGQMRPGRYIGWATIAEEVIRSLNEGRIVATDAQAYVLANREKFTSATIEFFETKSIEELEQMWLDQNGFRLGMRDARQLRLALVKAMNKAKEGVPALVASRLATGGLSEVKVLHVAMGGLFNIDFDIAQIGGLMELTRGPQRLFDEVFVEEYVRSNP